MKRVLLYLSLVLTCQWVLAQTAGEDAIYTGLQHYVRNIADFSRKHPQEKVYLHMDNRSYYIGDTIWFKAYVMDATTLHPTHTSGVLYVELLNDFGAEIDCKKLEIQDGMCHGEFILKDDYRTGFYEIRAYTRNMLNFGESYLLSLGYTRPWTYVEPTEVFYFSALSDSCFGDRFWSQGCQQWGWGCVCVCGVCDVWCVCVWCYSALA